MNREQGFTLMELMVVLIIVALLAAGGLGSLARWQQQQRLWQSALALRQFLLYQRDRALAANMTVQLTTQHQGRILAATNPDDVNDTPALFDTGAADIRLNPVRERLGFYGNRATAWPGHITLSSSAGRWRAVISAWGRVRLCRPDTGNCL